MGFKLHEPGRKKKSFKNENTGSGDGGGWEIGEGEDRRGKKSAEIEGWMGWQWIGGRVFKNGLEDWLYFLCRFYLAMF